MVETVKHLVFHCTKHEEIRQHVEGGELRPETLVNNMVSPEKFHWEEREEFSMGEKKSKTEVRIVVMIL